MRKHIVNYPIIKLEELDDSYRDTYVLPYLETLKRPRTKHEYLRQILYVSSYFKFKRSKDYLFTQLNEEDAKQYFLVYLSGLCHEGELSYDTFCLRLTVCKNFSRYIEQRDAQLGLANNNYSPPFEKIIRPASPPPVRESRILSAEELDHILMLARIYDRRLYMIYLLSFRMALKQRELLALKREHFDFFTDNGHDIGILQLVRQNSQSYIRIPSDILPEVKKYVEEVPSGHIFLNQWMNPLSAKNLSTLVKNFSSTYGIHVAISQLRTRGLIDLVSSNQTDKEAVLDYTGLSGQMIDGYARAMDHIKGGCVADNCQLQVVGYKENDK